MKFDTNVPDHDLELEFDANRMPYCGKCLEDVYYSISKLIWHHK